MAGQIPVRHHVVTIPQHPVEGAAGRDERLLGLGVDDRIHERVHHRAFDAGQIARAFLIRSRTGPVVAPQIEQFQLLYIDDVNYSKSFRNTLQVDKIKDTEEALIEIYRRLRPSSPPTPEVAQSFFDSLFFQDATQ